MSTTFFSGARLGATVSGESGADFLVWAPYAKDVRVHLFDSADRELPLQPLEEGYFGGRVEHTAPGALYKYRLDGREFPDPASRSQPEGVHAPSAILSAAFNWTDQGWTGINLAKYIFYELHIGTFTPEGTFDAAIQRLDYLAELGVTAVELMPVAQFPGARNWGYDGVYPFAVQNSYGGAAGLKRFVDAAHARGLAVALDVVYNHLGPEGNYFGQFGPYFTHRYRTPWGLAVNFDGPESGPVRRFVIENALEWVTDFHIDALRLDAVHAIFDNSARHILEELASTVHERGIEMGRRIHVIAESDQNESRLIEPVAEGGYGLDAVWSDDFHHALHCVLTKERSGYYRDFGSVSDVTKALGEGFVYSGQFSEHRGRCHGTSSAQAPAERFVVCTQNHDQVGNRMLGERLSGLVDYESLKLAAGVLVLSPFLPLLFMGEEYGETAPFLYFVSHSDPALIEAVRRGRREEFAAFSWQGEAPDPQAPETFKRSQLDHSLRESGRHRALLAFYKTLIQLRKEMPALRNLRKDPAGVSALPEQSLVVLRRAAQGDSALTVFHLGDKEFFAVVAADSGLWRKRIDSSDVEWMGPGAKIPGELQSDGELKFPIAPKSVCLLQKLPGF